MRPPCSTGACRTHQNRVVVASWLALPSPIAPRSNGETLPAGGPAEGPVEDEEGHLLIVPPPRAVSQSLRSAEKNRERRRCSRRFAAAQALRRARPRRCSEAS